MQIFTNDKHWHCVFDSFVYRNVNRSKPKFYWIKFQILPSFFFFHLRKLNDGFVFKLLNKFYSISNRIFYVLMNFQVNNLMARWFFSISVDFFVLKEILEHHCNMFRMCMTACGYSRLSMPSFQYLLCSGYVSLLHRQHIKLRHAFKSWSIHIPLKKTINTRIMRSAK